MYLYDAIQKIFANPGALVQILDGQFLILSDSEVEIREIQSQIGGTFLDLPQLYKPTFFSSKQNLTFSEEPSFSGQALKDYRLCLMLERKKLERLMEAALAQSPGLTLTNKIHWINQERNDFELDFKKIQEHIHSGTIDKAVLMTAEQSSWKPSVTEHLKQISNLLQKCPPHLYIYSHWERESGVVGASPELLFFRNKKVIESMALAGTLKYIKGSLEHLDFANASLRKDLKENLEHQFVVEDLKEKLAGFSLKPTLSGLEVIELPHLLHLQTKLRAELDEVPTSHNFDIQLAQTLHPTAALGIRSKKIHWHWLKELKGHQNLGHYGAPVGLPLPNGFFCLVGIRNLEWTQNGSFIRAGCGIVSQSEIQKEWSELEAKRESVKSLLGLI